MRKILDIAFKVADSDATVLLLGESGTGKSLLARVMHQRSRRIVDPFVTVSCPSLSRELLESELFGHVRGAFTSAHTDSEGRITSLTPVRGESFFPSLEKFVATLAIRVIIYKTYR